MAMVNAKFDSSQFQKDVKALGKRFSDKELADALGAGASILRTGIQRETHVVTGALLQDISQSGAFIGENGITIRVGTNVEYARAEEFGGRFKVTDRQRAFLHTIGIHLRADTKYINRKGHHTMEIGYYNNIQAALNKIIQKLKALI